MFFVLLLICLFMVCLQSLQVAQRETQIRLLEGQLRQTDVIGSSHNHMILDALREKAEYNPELQALIHNVQLGEWVCVVTLFVSEMYLNSLKVDLNVPYSESSNFYITSGYIFKMWATLSWLRNRYFHFSHGKV